MRHVLGRRAALALALTALVPLAACNKKGHDATSAATSTSAARAKVTPISGKAHVTGTITLMKAPAASYDPISTPFTFTVPDAGRGGLELPQALVSGKPNAIVWTGGRPLPVTGTCKLDPGEAATTVDSGGAHIALDGKVRALTAGTCAFGSSVAVGSHGISNPVDSVSFSLPADSDFTTSGGAAVTVPAARRYEGRDGGIELSGPLQVETETDKFDATSLSLTAGTWVVNIMNSGTPAALHVVADLQGTMQATS
ncbi:MAG: hypothetical protein QOJ00_2221 [Actinomycetota bacterium]